MLYVNMYAYIIQETCNVNHKFDAIAIDGDHWIE